MRKRCTNDVGNARCEGFFDGRPNAKRCPSCRRAHRSRSAEHRARFGVRPAPELGARVGPWRIGSDTYDALCGIAAEEGRTLSELGRDALEVYVAARQEAADAGRQLLAEEAELERGAVADNPPVDADGRRSVHPMAQHRRIIDLDALADAP